MGKIKSSPARKALKSLFYATYKPASKVWRKLDRLASWGEVHYWIDNVPNAIFTSSTYNSYANWIYYQGVFSALLSVYLERENPKIFDFGCGMGNLAPVCDRFLGQDGRYLGVDLDAASIAACEQTYKNLKRCSFYRTRDTNDYYVQRDRPGRESDEIDWPVTDGSQDLVIAMSVFTHLREPESIRYMSKIHRILSKGGLAILSFLVVRDNKNAHELFNFTHPLTPGWFTSNPECPEMAIGVSQEALRKLVTPGFEIVKQLEGRMTGGRTPLLQDMLILRKRESQISG